MEKVNQAIFENTIKEGYTFVDFYADWCGPCKMLSPILEEVTGEYPDVTFIKVNVDEEGELAATYGILSIPALFLFKDGKVLAQTGGFQPKATLKHFLDTAMAKAGE